jgi:hypothetical protein
MANGPPPKLIPFPTSIPAPIRNGCSIDILVSFSYVIFIGFGSIIG